MAVEKKRMSLLISAELKDELDEFCKRMGISQSAAVSVIMKTYFDQQKIVKMVELAEEQQRQK